MFTIYNLLFFFVTQKPNPGKFQIEILQYFTIFVEKHLYEYY